MEWLNHPYRKGPQVHVGHMIFAELRSSDFTSSEPLY